MGPGGEDLRLWDVLAAGDTPRPHSLEAVSFERCPLTSTGTVTLGSIIGEPP
jgi:hypothetical protein